MYVPLPSLCAISRTDLGYGAIPDHHRACESRGQSVPYLLTCLRVAESAVLNSRMGVPGEKRGRVEGRGGGGGSLLLSHDAFSMLCPVLTFAMLLPGGVEARHPARQADAIGNTSLHMAVIHKRMVSFTAMLAVARV
eukprot:2644051-Rhodomonas_salina.3